MLLNINFFFVNTCGYPWILKKYASTRITNTPTDMGTGTRRIFIQLVGYRSRTLPAALTSLILITHTSIINLTTLTKDFSSFKGVSKPASSLGHTRLVIIAKEEKNTRPQSARVSQYTKELS